MEKRLRVLLVLVAVASGAVILGAALLVSSSCLYSPAPIARKVEPGKIAIEASGGVGTDWSSAVAQGWLYAGIPFGGRFEVGLLPMLASTTATIAVPVKWDWSPHDAAVHVICFLGPGVVFSPSGVVPLVTGGLAATWDLSRAVGLFAAVTFPAASIGARVSIAPWIQLGVSATYAGPPAYTAANQSFFVNTFVTLTPSFGRRN
jgi:hypothetical protein